MTLESLAQAMEEKARKADQRAAKWQRQFQDGLFMEDVTRAHVWRQAADMVRKAGLKELQRS